MQIKLISLLLPIILLTLCIGCSAESDLPSDFSENNDKFIRSIDLLNESRDLSNPPGSETQQYFTLSEEIENEITIKTEEGIRLSKEISDEYLDYLHEELKYMFREKLIKGTEITYEGWKENESGNTTKGFLKQLEGNNLVKEWIDWFQENLKGFEEKVFGD